MKAEEIKIIIDSVLSKLQQSDAMLNRYFKEEQVIKYDTLMNMVKQSIGELEYLSDELKS